MRLILVSEFYLGYLPVLYYNVKFKEKFIICKRKKANKIKSILLKDDSLIFDEKVGKTRIKCVHYVD